MQATDGTRQLVPHLTPSQRDLLHTYLGKVPNPDWGLSLLNRWAEGTPLPAGDVSFLHLLYLAASSESLFLSLLRRPSQFTVISRQASRSEGLGHEGMEEALARLFLAESERPAAHVLSAFRSSQTARILIQDVLGVLSFEGVTRELSALADVLVAKAFSLTYQPLREEMGMPLRLAQEGRTLSCPLSVFSLGKLGGGELNYASDVDLVCFFRSEGETDRGVPNQLFFNGWVQAATALLTAATPNGPCLRVDTALRPRGRDGELTLSFNAALSYYKEWADLWERQAWIKARLCAGDKDEGTLFLRRMEDVIYRPYSFSGIAGRVREQREKTIRKLERGERSGARNVKEGRGGIRSAEFAVQALQLAYGQRDRWIREGHTLLAMQKLEQKGILSPSTRSSMSWAYTLLRRAEHWAQVQGMQQTHRLPASPGEWAALGRYLRLPPEIHVEKEIERCRSTLSRLFDQTLSELERRVPGENELASLLSEKGRKELLARAGVRDAPRALPYLDGIYRELSASLDTPGRKEKAVRVHYSLRRELAKAPDPRAGLQALFKVTSSLAGELGGLSSLVDDPRQLRLLFRLISRSESILDAVVRWPFLLESLTYERMRGVETEITPPGEWKGSGDDLRRHQKIVLFLVHAREIIMGDGIAWSAQAHSALADFVCAAVFERSCALVEEREGLPEKALSGSLALLALGRLGFREMQPRSDLDVGCVKEGPWVLPKDPERSAGIELTFMRALVAGFTAVTRHGALYDVDFRLRPYGDSGPQIQSRRALEEYFSGPARLWERLAYLKGRPVAGRRDLAENVLAGVWRSVLERGAVPEEIGELLDLRRRLEESTRDVEGAVKFRPGGLLHLDLLLLLLQVKAAIPPETGGTAGLLDRLASAGVLSGEDRAELYVSRAFQEALLHRCRLHLARPPGVGRLSSGLSKIQALWQASATKLGEAPPKTGLEAEWARCRETVEAHWRRLTP